MRKAQTCIQRNMKYVEQEAEWWSSHVKLQQKDVKEQCDVLADDHFCSILPYLAITD